ncbi:MAG: sulfatase [Granulicella sp.]
MTRRELLAMTSIGIAGTLLPEALASSVQGAPGHSSTVIKPMNVLFIAVDDLRPQMNCYGHKQMVTPNFDKLAAGSTIFRSNYCQQAVCSPSRTSMLTGCRPDTTKVYDLVKFFRETLPDVVTLPQHFKKHGYFAEAVGKIFHEDLNDPASWSIPAAFDTSAEELEQYQLRESYHEEAERLHQIPRHGLVYGPPFEAANAPDDDYLDGRIATEAIRRLKIQGAKKLDTPFFLAVGFHKPHLPFVCPKRYWDLYDPSEIELPSYREKPKGADDLVMTHSDELRPYYGVPFSKEPISDSLSRKLIHGYYAGVSFTDAQIGRLLTVLEQEGFADNTIVVLAVDHGWHLADHGLFCKHTNFEHATHVPMMIRLPGMASSEVDGLIENIDIYPTLCELAGLPAPEHVEGTSFVPLMHDPRRAWKTASFSQYPRPGGIMGYSMRTKRYRYTRWIQTKDQAVVTEELYDYQTDPEETTNWVASQEHADVLGLLRRQSAAGWKAAGPPV